jgi:tellurite methyltransferase
MKPPAIELTQALLGVTPGRALDLACGAGRHAIWLRDRDWQVTAVDLAAEAIQGVTFVTADLERHEFPIEPQTWDLIVCWLYWQEDLLPPIAAGLRPGGIVALAGKTTGRFATSLAQYRHAFTNWKQIAAGEDTQKAYLIASKP